MSLLDYLGLGGLCGMGHGPLGNPIEDGKRAQMEASRLDILFGSVSVHEYKVEISDGVTFEGECSVVEIDGKKLLEEM
jgi:hypothetical protein